MEELYAYRRQMMAQARAQVQRLAGGVEKIDPESMHTPLEEGGWSAHQVLVHMRDVEQQAFWPRVEDMLQHDQPELQYFDEGAWMQEHYDEQEDVQAILDGFQEARMKMLAAVEAAGSRGMEPRRSSPDPGAAHGTVVVRVRAESYRGPPGPDVDRLNGPGSGCQGRGRRSVMDYSAIVPEVQGKVGLIRINRPKAMNALDRTVMTELTGALQAFDEDEAIGAIVITGDDRAFAAGADIKEMAGAGAVDMLITEPIELWDRVSGIHKPVIAAVSGWCLGGGCELAMSCDMIVASETAVFGQPEINLGVIPGAGGTQRLTRAVGKATAMEMVLNDRRLDAHEALQLGLVNRVVPRERYLQEALGLAAEIADRAPLAVRIGKEMVNQAFETVLAEGIADERRSFYFLFSSLDQKEGMQAFLEKRKAGWKGR